MMKMLLYDTIRGELKAEGKDKALDKNEINENIKKYDRHKLRAILRKYIRHSNRLLNYHKYKEVIDNFEPFKNVFIIYSNSFLNKNKIFNYTFRYSKIIKILYLNKKGKRLIYGDNNYLKENTLTRNKKGRSSERIGLLLDDNKFANEDNSNEEKIYQIINFFYTLKKSDYDKLDKVIEKSQIALPSFSYFDIYLFSNNKKLKYEINKKNIKYIDISSVLYYLYIPVIISYIHLKDFQNAKIKFFEYIYLKRKFRQINKYCSESEKRKLRITTLISSQLKNKIYNYYDTLLYEKKPSSIFFKRSDEMGQKGAHKKKENKDSIELPSNGISTKIKNKFILTGRKSKQDDAFKERTRGSTTISIRKSKRNNSSLRGSDWPAACGSLPVEASNGLTKPKGGEICPPSVKDDTEADVIKEGTNRIDSNEHNRSGASGQHTPRGDTHTGAAVTKEEDPYAKKRNEYLLFLKIKHKETSLDGLTDVVRNIPLEDKICRIKRLRNIMNIEYNEKKNIYRKEKILKNLIQFKDKKYYFYNYFFDVLIYFSYFKQINIVEGILLMALLYSKLNFFSISTYIYKNVYLYFYYIFESYQRKWKSFDLNHEMNKLNSFNVKGKENTDASYAKHHKDLKDERAKKKKGKKDKKKKKKKKKMNTMAISTSDVGTIESDKRETIKGGDFFPTPTGELHRSRGLEGITSVCRGSKDIAVGSGAVDAVREGGKESIKMNKSKREAKKETKSEAKSDAKSEVKNHNKDNHNDDKNDDKDNLDQDEHDSYGTCSMYDELVVHTFNHFQRQLRNNSNFYFVADWQEQKPHFMYRNYAFLNNSFNSPHLNYLDDIVVGNIIKNAICFNYKYIFNGIKRHILIYLNLISHVETKYIFHKNNYNLKNLIYHLYMDKILKSYDTNLFTYEKNFYVLKRIIFLDNGVNLFHPSENYLTNDYCLKSIFFKIYFNLYKNTSLKVRRRNARDKLADDNSCMRAELIHQYRINVWSENGKDSILHSLINLEEQKMQLGGYPVCPHNRTAPQYQLAKQKNEGDAAVNGNFVGEYLHLSDNSPSGSSRIFNFTMGTSEQFRNHMLSSYLTDQCSHVEMKGHKTENVYQEFNNFADCENNNVKEGERTPFLHFRDPMRVDNCPYSHTISSLELLRDNKRYNSDIPLNKSGPIIKSVTLVDNLNSPSSINVGAKSDWQFDDMYSGNSKKRNFTSGDEADRKKKVATPNRDRKNDKFIETIFKKNIKKNLFGINRSLNESHDYADDEEEDGKDNLKNYSLRNFFNFPNNELKILIYNFLYLYIFDEYIYMNMHKKDISEYFNFLNVLKKKQKLRYNFCNFLWHSNKDIGNEISCYKKYLKERYLNKNKKKDNNKMMYNSMFGEQTTIQVNMKKDMNDKCKTKSAKKLSKKGEEYKMVREHKKEENLHPMASIILINNKKEKYNSKAINLLRDTYKKNFINYHIKINVEKYEHIYFLFIITEMLSIIFLPFINSHYYFAYIKGYKHLGEGKFTPIERFRQENIHLLCERTSADGASVDDVSGDNATIADGAEGNYKRKSTKQSRINTQNQGDKRNRLIKSRKQDISTSIYNLFQLNKTNLFNFSNKEKKEKSSDSEETKSRKILYRKNTLSNIKNETAYIQKYSLFNERKEKWNDVLYSKTYTTELKRRKSTKYPHQLDDGNYYIALYNSKVVEQIRRSKKRITFEAKNLIENVFLYNEYYRIDTYELNKKFHSKDKYFLIKKYEKIVALAFYTRFNSYLIFSLYQRIALLNFLYSNYHLVISILRYINHVHCKLINQHARRHFFLMKKSPAMCEKSVGPSHQGDKVHTEFPEMGKSTFFADQSEKCVPYDHSFFYMKDEDIHYNDYIINTYSTNYINDMNAAKGRQDSPSSIIKFYDKLGDIKSFRFSIFFDIFFELKVNFNHLSSAYICVQNSLRYLFFFLKNAHKCNVVLDLRHSRERQATLRGTANEVTSVSDERDNNMAKPWSGTHRSKNKHSCDAPQVDSQHRRVKSETNLHFQSGNTPHGGNKTLDEWNRKCGESFDDTSRFAPSGQNYPSMENSTNRDGKDISHNVNEENCYTENDSHSNWLDEIGKEPNCEEKGTNEESALTTSEGEEWPKFIPNMDINKLRSSRLFYIIGISLLKQLNSNYYYDNMKEINLIYEDDLVEKKINVNNLLKNDYSDVLNLSYKYMRKSISVDPHHLLSYYYLGVIYLYKLKVTKCIYICKNFLLQNCHNVYAFSFFLLYIVVTSSRYTPRKVLSTHGRNKCGKADTHKSYSMQTPRGKNKGDGSEHDALINHANILHSYNEQYKGLINQLRRNAPDFYNAIMSTNNLFDADDEKKAGAGGGTYMDDFCNLGNFINCNDSGGKRPVNCVKENPSDVPYEVKSNGKSDDPSGSHDMNKTEHGEPPFGPKLEKVNITNGRTPPTGRSAYDKLSTHCTGGRRRGSTRGRKRTSTPYCLYNGEGLQTKSPNNECFLILTKAINYFPNNFFFFYLYVYYLINFFVIYDILFYWEKKTQDKKNKKRTFPSSKVKHLLLQKASQTCNIKSSPSEIPRPTDHFNFLREEKKADAHLSQLYDAIFDTDEMDNGDSDDNNYTDESARNRDSWGGPKLTRFFPNVPFNLNKCTNLAKGKNEGNRVLTNSIKEEIDRIQISLKILQKKSNAMRIESRMEGKANKVGASGMDATSTVTKSPSGDGSHTVATHVGSAADDEKCGEYRHADIAHPAGKNQPGDANVSQKNKQNEGVNTEERNARFMEPPSVYDTCPNELKSNIKRSDYIDISKVNLLPCVMPILLVLYKYILQKMQEKKNSDMYVYFCLNKIMSHVDLSKIKCELHAESDRGYHPDGGINNCNCFFSYAKGSDKLYSKNYYFSERNRCGVVSGSGMLGGSYMVTRSRLDGRSGNKFGTLNSRNSMSNLRNGTPQTTGTPKGMRKISLKNVYLEAITWISMGEILIYLRVNAKLIAYLLNIIDTYIKFYLSVNNDNNYYSYENTSFFYNLTHQFMCLKCLYLFYLYAKCKRRKRYSDILLLSRKGSSSICRLPSMAMSPFGEAVEKRKDNGKWKSSLPFKKNLYTKILFFENEYELHNARMNLCDHPKVKVENEHIYFSDRFGENDFKLPFHTRDKKELRGKFWPLRRKAEKGGTDKGENKESPQRNAPKENASNGGKCYSNDKADTNNKVHKMNRMNKKRMNKIYADEEKLISSFFVDYESAQKRQKKYRLVKNIKIYVSLISKIYFNDRKVNILYARYYFLKKKYLKVISILSLLNEHYKKRDYFIMKKKRSHEDSGSGNNMNISSEQSTLPSGYPFHLNNQTDFVYEYLNIYMYYQSFEKLQNYRKSNYYKHILKVIFLSCPIIPFGLFPFINL
ncbi:hypothetical protein C922_00204 [Plasmodium inui San Antonio 1]|uniref:Uncharacterized protein n=1 Tax=Plasmodium inui San Antonio 1 TaxID=1237626 RepID=W7AVA0_9APIC|nr:hypothetical protein C922_00204 [Plasmodium inui San Antonio 1]EUD69341.1 hypothetical protein C922_00204 [Plasmodium inui San Antonio 1]